MFLPDREQEAIFYNETIRLKGRGSSDMEYYEITTRSYANGVEVGYEFLSEKEVYIHSIESHLKKCGNGTDAMKHFIQSFSGFNIYLYSSDELGTGREILDKWYSSMGFLDCDRKDLKYNVTHCLES